MVCHKCRWAMAQGFDKFHTKRLAKIFETIPVNTSLHCDAWRDINLSYDNETEEDPWGWILENEEMRCGCETERDLYECRASYARDSLPSCSRHELEVCGLAQGVGKRLPLPPRRGAGAG